jgi:hypothetical protein
MKKLFILIFILSGIYFGAFAQTKNGVEFGANIGFNASYVQVTPTTIDSKAESGFNLGVSADYYLSDRWSIKGKLIYDQKGWGNGFLSQGDATSSSDVDFRLNYLTIPVMANWHFGKTRNWYLHCGPYVGFLLNAKDASNNTDLTGSFTGTDFGVDFGLGVKFHLSNKAKLFIEGDGQGGFSNIFKQNTDTEVKNARTSINVGISFPLD